MPPPPFDPLEPHPHMDGMHLPTSVSQALGGTMFGVLFSFFLLGILTLQLAIYFRRFPNDMMALKVIVALLGITEYIHCGLLAHTLYVVGVSEWGHPDIVLDYPPESLAASLTISVITDTILQTYLTLRMYLLSPHRILAVGVWLVIATRFGLSIFLTSQVYIVESWSEFKYGWGWIMVAVIAMSPAIDIIIASALFYALRRSRVGLSAATLGMIRQLIQWTVVNGIIAAISGLATLFLFIFVPHTEKLTIGVYSILHGFFSISFLVSLNAREELRRRSVMPSGPEMVMTATTTGTRISSDTAMTEEPSSPISFAKPPSAEQLNVTVGAPMERTPLDEQGRRPRHIFHSRSDTDGQIQRPEFQR